MIAILRRTDVREAAVDLRRRTLAGIPRALDRLIYLSSTRDYNTGLYYHDGLASRYTQEVACEALADCHAEAFRELVHCPLEDLVGQVEAYIGATHANQDEFVAAWTKLEPYRVAVPVATDPLSAEFLFSNIRIALAVLEARLQPHRAGAGASPRPSRAQ